MDRPTPGKILIRFLRGTAFESSEKVEGKATLPACGGREAALQLVPDRLRRIGQEIMDFLEISLDY
jgi:hypothetical protein